jgi:hypothetical protein
MTLNPQASEFTPSVSAAAFVPGAPLLGPRGGYCDPARHAREAMTPVDEPEEEMTPADEGLVDHAVGRGLEGDAAWVGACVHVKVALNPKS